MHVYKLEHMWWSMLTDKSLNKKVAIQYFNV